MKIRKLYQNEKNKVFELYLDLIKYEYNISNVENIKEPNKYRKDYEKFFNKMLSTKPSQVYVAVENKDIVGFVYGRVDKQPSIYVNKRKGHAQGLYLKPEHRGTRAVYDLWENLKNWFYEQNVKQVSCNTLESNPVCPLMKRAGFKETSINLINVLDKLEVK